MVLHHHQPVGNFPEVFRETYDRCYRPTLELLEDFPDIHASIHLTGPLLVWVEENAPEYVERLVRLSKRQQIEVIGGGFYEPILAMLPACDARAQVERMNGWMKDRLGVTTPGFWLAERVWQTDLPARLGGMGLGYAPVDDHHFLLSGLPPEELHGYFRAGWLDRHLDLFPISRDLRYIIPFQLPEALLDYMDRNGRKGRVLTYADDAEKFGVWPETYHWVWEKGYLRSLFEQITRQSHWLRVASMGEIVAERKPSGRVVLPNASYEEMMEWALPAKSGIRFNAVKKDLEQRGILPSVQPFLRGGIFENFLVKYPDVARLYGRMLQVSHIAEGDGNSEALEALMRAQGNDVYWHGLFGGIYLSNLRHEAYSNLLRAEDALVRSGKIVLPSVLEGDFDQDGLDELFLFRETYTIWMAPGKGASLTEIDDRRHFFHLTNTMTRQFEAYHDRANPVDEHASSGVIPSIHDMSSGVVDHSEILYDPRPRRAFVDGIYPSDVTGNELDQALRCFSDFSDTSFRTVSRSPDNVLFEAVIPLEGNPWTITKEYRLLPGSFSVRYQLSGELPGPGTWMDGKVWATEIPLTMLAGEEHGRRLVLRDRHEDVLLWLEASDRESVTGVEGYDDWSKAGFSIGSSIPVRLVLRPLHSVSLSEKGVEKVYQGTLFFLLVPLSVLAREGWQVAFSFEQEDRRIL